MSKNKIPIRPSGKFGLSDEQQDAITWHMLSGMPRTEVFAKFIKPSYAGTKNALETATRMFFDDREVKRYMEEYKKTLDVFLDGEKEENSKEKELTEDDKQKAIRSVANQVVSLAKRAGSADVDIELVIKLMDKLQWLDDKDATVEPPKRFLAVSCSECLYKSFCEKELDSPCKRCKFKEYANNNGIIYKPEEQLKNPNKD